MTEMGNAEQGVLELLLCMFVHWRIELSLLNRENEKKRGKNFFVSNQQPRGKFCVLSDWNMESSLSMIHVCVHFFLLNSTHVVIKAHSS